MIDKQKLERRFSRNAKTYDDYAVVQKEMSKKLIEQIRVNEPAHILEIGCGTGYLTALIANQYPKAKILALDLAPGMIDVAKKRFSNINTGNQVEFVCGDIENAFPEGNYDLIISNATFQWFNHPDETSKKIIRSLTDNGQCLFSTFGEHTFHELSKSFELASEALGLSHQERASQSFQTEKAWIQRIENAKSVIGVRGSVQVYDELLPEFFEDCMSFFKSVKKIGANKASTSRTNTSPKFMQTVTECYEENFRTEDGIKATYHALYVSFVK